MSGFVTTNNTSARINISEHLVISALGMCYAMTLLLGVITVQCSTNSTVMLVTLYFTWTSEKVIGFFTFLVGGKDKYTKYNSERK